MKKYLLPVLLISFLFAACENTWDSDTRDMFKRSCVKTFLDDGMEKDRADKICDCRLEKIMEKHPNFSEAMENLKEIITDPDVKACENLE